MFLLVELPNQSFPEQSLSVRVEVPEVISVNNRLSDVIFIHCSKLPKRVTEFKFNIALK